MKTKTLILVLLGSAGLAIPALLLVTSCRQECSETSSKLTTVSKTPRKSYGAMALTLTGEPCKKKVDFRAFYRSVLKKEGIDDFSTESLIDLMDSQNPSVRGFSMLLLGERKELSAIPKLEKALSDESIIHRTVATRALLKMGNRKGIKVLEEFCEKASKEFDEGNYKNVVRLSDALTVLAEAGEVSAIPHLRKLLGYKLWAARLTAVRSLSKFYKKEPAVLDDIASMLDDEHPQVRKYASDFVQRIQENK